MVFKLGFRAPCEWHADIARHHTRCQLFRGNLRKAPDVHMGQPSAPQFGSAGAWAKNPRLAPSVSMDRLARNLDDLRRIVHSLTRRGVRITFMKENLTFTGEDSPMAHLMLSVMGAFAEFERALLRERQREGIALAKQRGVYRGRKRSLTSVQIAEVKRRIGAGEQKAQVARAFGISRETLYQYLRAL